MLYIWGVGVGRGGDCPVAHFGRYMYMYVLVISLRGWNLVCWVLVSLEEWSTVKNSNHDLINSCLVLQGCCLLLIC